MCKCQRAIESAATEAYGAIGDNPDLTTRLTGVIGMWMCGSRNIEEMTGWGEYLKTQLCMFRISEHSRETLESVIDDVCGGN